MDIDSIKLLNANELMNCNKNVNKKSSEQKIAGRNFKAKDGKLDEENNCNSNVTNENVSNYTFKDEFLSYERVAKKSQRSLAIINSDDYIQVITKIGTWNSYGYSYMGELYLHSYEALYLIETNRLELLYDSVIVSLEQAYCLFIKNDDDDEEQQPHQSDSNDYSPKLNIQEYLVYSNFMKAGYIIRKYSAKNDQHYHHHHSVGQPITYKNDIILSERHKCIWNHLFMINQKRSKYEIPDNELQLKVTQSFIDVNEKIKNHDSFDMDDENYDLNDLLLIKTRNDRQQLTMKTSNDLLPTTSSTEPPPNKKIKPNEIINENKNPLDQLLNTKEYQRFESIFQQLQIINLPKLMVNEEDTDTDTDSFSDQNILPLFHFDLYIDDNFKKSTPGIPKYRILILKKPPTRQFIVKRYSLQNHKVPILIIFVTESMNFNGFIYRFSM